MVHVRDAIWGFELTQRAAEISERLPGRPRLKFTPGPVPETVAEPPRAVPMEASPEQVRQAEEMAAGIVDRNLRESVAQTIKATLARTPHDRPEEKNTTFPARPDPTWLISADEIRANALRGYPA